MYFTSDEELLDVPPKTMNTLLIHCYTVFEYHGKFRIKGRVCKYDNYGQTKKHIKEKKSGKVAEFKTEEDAWHCLFNTWFMLKIGITRRKWNSAHNILY